MVCFPFFYCSFCDVLALSSAQQEAILSQIPSQRFGTADEVAEVVCFLASPHAAYITGQEWNVDGAIRV